MTEGFKKFTETSQQDDFSREHLFDMYTDNLKVKDQPKKYGFPVSLIYPDSTNSADYLQYGTKKFQTGLDAPMDMMPGYMPGMEVLYKFRTKDEEETVKLTKPMQKVGEVLGLDRFGDHKVELGIAHCNYYALRYGLMTPMPDSRLRPGH